MRILIAILALIALPAFADGGDKQLTGKRKYDIVVAPETDENAVIKTNEAIEAQLKTHSEKVKADNEGARGFLRDLVLNLATLAQDRTVATTDAFANLLIQSAQGSREKWLQAARQQCHYKHTIKEAAKVDDFYWLPSSQGALDPAYIRFKGFGCRSYIECVGCEECKPQQGEKKQSTESDSIHGLNVFYVWCSLRTDDDGIAEMVNHSKFLVQVDTFAFMPAKCELPCDSTGQQAEGINFSFDKRKDLTFNLTTTFYSSWINEAIMVTNDQPLGTFTIHVEIDSTQLNSDGIYTYSRRDTIGKKVDINCDCFLVPRSYTGTLDGTNHQPAWGTGQYRIEMTLEETCQINEDYYYKPMEVLTEPDTTHMAGNQEQQQQPQQQQDQQQKQQKRKWDRDKWKDEWKAMQGDKKSDFWKQAAQVVQGQMIGNNWVTTVTTPVLTTISESETEWLERVLGTGTSSSAAGAMPAP